MPLSGWSSLQCKSWKGIKVFAMRVRWKLVSYYNDNHTTGSLCAVCTRWECPGQVYCSQQFACQALVRCLLGGKMCCPFQGWFDFETWGAVTPCHCEYPSDICVEVVRGRRSFRLSHLPGTPYTGTTHGVPHVDSHDGSTQVTFSLVSWQVSQL